MVAEATYTLEADLLGEPANTAVLRASYLKQHPRSAAKWDEITGDANPPEALYRKLSDDKRFISKGEFAHDVAISVQEGEAFAAPTYLRNAITGVLSEPGASGGTGQAE